MIWRSLRSRIILLAVVTCAFLAVAAAAFFGFLRSSHTDAVSVQQRHLERVANTLVNTYINQAATGLNFRTALPAPPVPPLHPPPAPPALAAPPPPPPPPPADPLSQLTSSVLQREEGIEGGFLAGEGPLRGYAFPTHEGPGPQKEMPGRERPTIDRLAHQAEATGTPQSLTFEGTHDVVLFQAQPIREPIDGKSHITGAVWLMQRLPGINRGRSRDFALATWGFGIAALVTALLAWFVMVEIRGGVQAVSTRLEALQSGLPGHPPQLPLQPLAEFQRVLTGIDVMAASLQTRVANERTLEAELRHRERLSALGQFAAGVAHELRNPLATIRLRAQMSQHAAADVAADAPVIRNSSVILEEVDRLDVMISRLLSFSRPISLHLQQFDLCDLCQVCVNEWAGRASSTLRLLCICPAPAIVRADRSRLLQVLDNLVENAVQATASVPQPEVTLTVRNLGQTVLIDVTDNGTGFSPDALHHALDPFFTTRDAGTGLGLSIAFELVEAHGGTLKLGTRPGGGALVTLTLPTGFALTS